jgi:putative acetyltransferase
MRAISPPESKHALDLEGLRKPDITFWTLWMGGKLAGCCALKELDSRHGEIKSMRTATASLRKGVAARLLQNLIDVAQGRAYERLSLETGSMPYFEPARSLYRRFGFRECGPFAAYVVDPNSVFMTLDLSPRRPGSSAPR